ncbi:tetratricopeptide repeat protein [Sneathiella glossodoripedis]|uniref:tetratricopeptide repeat protein n=1 Tax=Sneathiella glossodoripedis TaxID=418853 RepID=UPI0004717ADA|nr:tetratricopeptide repeat protein [Sneathiella glossodoripedis]
MKLKGLALVLYAMAATHFLNAEMVFAMGSSSSPSAVEKAADPDFAMGKKQIDSKNWEGAISSFSKVVAKDPNNADAFNYLGYAERNAGNYSAAFEAYNKALSIDPNHKGANEYIGEAYLKTDNLAKAEEHLKKLDEICTFGCAEYTMLQRAIAKYRGANS